MVEPVFFAEEIPTCSNCKRQNKILILLTISYLSILLSQRSIVILRDLWPIVVTLWSANMEVAGAQDHISKREGLWTSGKPL